MLRECLQLWKKRRKSEEDGDGEENESAYGKRNEEIGERMITDLLQFICKKKSGADITIEGGIHSNT